MAEPGTGMTGREVIEPSVWNALLYFMSLTVFPLVVSAAIYGGWWIIGPFIFFGLTNWFDTLFGVEKRNMDPGKTLESQLLWYKLAVWMWAALWPVTLVFTLWQILVVGHLTILESVLIAVVLVGVAQSVFIVGHELVHQRSVWERRFGEFLLASVSYPHYATEHIYIHHALVCTPADPGSAFKGQSFWQYFPRDMARSLLEAWRFERNRLARRHLPVWHYTNPFWRYFFEIAAWYTLVYWMGDAWILLIFVILCIGVILSMKLINYVQHYGLQRIRLPSGRFERARLRHSWSAASKFTNWLYYNMQRHPDHHTAPTRYYPLLQYHGGDESPQLPDSYAAMATLAMFPERWFRTMDPLVDRWRAHFYPQIDDWSAYDSPAFTACPDAFEAIAEILGAAPRIAKWINLAPELLESLRDKEFTDLDLPDGFGPDPEFEAVARRGLARVYWTRELSVSEMKERIAAIPAQGIREVVETARNWSNDKVFQISMHMIRGSLSPVEAGTVLSNVAEASIAVLLSAIEFEFANQRTQRGKGAVVAVILGDPASGEAAPGAELDVLFVYDGGPVEYYETLCHRLLEGLRAFSHDNLLFAVAPGREGRAVRSLVDFEQHHRNAGSASELLDLTRARCVFASGDSGIGARFDKVRREILAYGAARVALLDRLREVTGGTAEPDLLSIGDMRGGLRDVERVARFLQLTHASDAPDILVLDAASIFQVADSHGLIPDGAAVRLVAATRMWWNLQGILRLVAEDGFTVEKASTKVKAVIARSCGMDDFDALTAVVRETASCAAADIGTTLDGMIPK